MKKTAGFILMFAGIILTILSIVGIIKAFDMFGITESSIRSILCAFTSIIIPLLVAVLGRWTYRKGQEFRKADQ
jgi:hypothetical protein